ncbi:MAG: Crp/Fnr family transcriptional regulator [Clostridia bacterium]|nr:Crp/Fnr family transcriptional regulator [Clostridia bacterium]
MEKFLPVLHQCALFAGIAEKEIIGLLRCMSAHIQKSVKGQTILAEGDKAGRLGVLLAGTAQISRTDYYGNRSIIARLEPGDLFAEAIAYAGIPVMPVSVTALEDAAVLLMDAQRFAQPCGKGCGFHQQMITNLIKVLAAKNLICNQKIEVTSKRSTREKLLAYLLLQAKQTGKSTFTIPYNRQELADYLEVDRSGLSNEISKLRQEGVLACTRSTFELLAQQPER